MIKLTTITATLATFLGFAAVASDASAVVMVQCDSSRWPNNQTCERNSAWRASVQTSSTSTGTSHAITVAMPAGAGDNRFAFAVALDGSGRVIPDSRIASNGPSSTRAFSTAASNPPRRLQTTLETPLQTPGGFIRPMTEDTWPVNINVRGFNLSGSLVQHCLTGANSNSALTSHTVSSNLRQGSACLAQPLDSFGQPILHLHDFNAGSTPETTTFTTTAANRPRRSRATAQ